MAARSAGRPNGPQLTCAVADCPLPIGTAVTLGLIADLLITNAFVYAFPPGLGGRIAVSFTVAPESWRLAIEDGGFAMPGEGDGRDNGLVIARLLVQRLDGRLETPRVADGTRYLASIPRSPTAA